MKHRLLFVLFSGLFISCSSNSRDSNEVTSPKVEETPKDSSSIVKRDSSSTSTVPNILFIIADDMGKDATNGYSEGAIKPKTPHLDSIRLKGVRFDNFWSYPTCTPTRASAITGKYGYRTGVKGVGVSLPTSETILQKRISQETSNRYATAIVGKWHLSGSGDGVNPEDFGLDYYAGLISGGVRDYYKWSLSEKGSTTTETSYITEKLTDLAIDWVDEQTKPWFLWLAYNAPHTPFHIPPSNMHNQGTLPSYADSLNAMPYYMAAIEAMDFQIGRLLDSLSKEERDNTLIIFMGDNGSPNIVAQSPYTRSTVKNTLYQGGINVPLFVSGKGVSRVGSDSNLVGSVDIFATVLEVAGISKASVHDSKSFAPLFQSSSKIRNYQYSEIKDNKFDGWAISNGSYKLIVSGDGSEELYRLTSDAYENTNILRKALNSEGQQAKSELEAELGKIRN